MTQGLPAAATSARADTSPHRDVVRSAVGVLKAVGHPLRFRIVELLTRQSRLSVTELCSVLKTRQPIISQQLSILRRHEVVKGFRDGNRVLYSLQHDCVGEIVRLLKSNHEQWGIESGELRQ